MPGRHCKSGKVQKGSNLITDGTMLKDDHVIKEKEVKCPISVSRLGLTEPSQNTGESLRQALDPENQVVKVGQKWMWVTHSRVLHMHNSKQ